MGEEPVPPEPPLPGRRDSWSLRTIVKEVSGHSLEEFQDPARAPHPYLRVKPPHGGVRPLAAPVTARPVLPSPAEAASFPEGAPDPVERVYPPLVGATGRRLHGSDGEHHEPTLHHLEDPAWNATPGRPASPSRRPERVYLHYLLLHLDRLNDHALRYLERAVDEELEHRKATPRASEGPSPP